MMRKTFETPKIDVLELDGDVITSSRGDDVIVGGGDDDNSLGWEPIN